MIRIENLTLNINKKNILSDINLEVPAGSRLAIVGLSGSGKSTILKCICGLYKIDTGKIFVCGAELSKPNLNIIRQKIGYVSQGNGLFPHLTVYENLKLATPREGAGFAGQAQDIDFLFQLTNLSIELLSKYPRQLSGGQSQRVEIVRALISKPKILLMDEPTSALDILTKRKFQRDLRPILDRFNTTLVLVSHDINEAAFFSSDIVVMDEGKIVQRGALEKLKTEPASELVRELTC